MMILKKVLKLGLFIILLTNLFQISVYSASKKNQDSSSKEKVLQLSSKSEKKNGHIEAMIKKLDDSNKIIAALLLFGHYAMLFTNSSYIMDNLSGLICTIQRTPKYKDAENVVNEIIKFANSLEESDQEIRQENDLYVYKTFLECIIYSLDEDKKKELEKKIWEEIEKIEKAVKKHMTDITQDMKNMTDLAKKLALTTITR